MDKIRDKGFRWINHVMGNEESVGRGLSLSHRF